MLCAHYSTLPDGDVAPSVAIGVVIDSRSACTTMDTCNTHSSDINIRHANDVEQWKSDECWADSRCPCIERQAIGGRDRLF